ncbi:PREDICTED: uncharacterized protein CXorf38 homolog isoform X3 [Gekko japonicus]|uniref:Uncharacterized protein CXorf38 homolog isoform X3 n=1 Tax=Gekko japonicus TaxID=146911 RepID=A0ABM1KJS1_GEKJA|nr:PREDICTED: uncharacterized protein CXorf38 homolog isoform X3 [Gekko japonicus]
MALAELAARLNCTEYKNWVKAGHSLLLLRAALQRYAGEQVQAFHRQLVARGTARLAPSGRSCRGRCTPRGRQFQPACSLCKEWKTEILNHHTHRNGEVNWGNCRPWLWPSNSWEFAKAYMPRGKADISGPDKCDAAALLNLFNFCDHFSSIDQMKVRELLSSDWAVHVPGEDQLDGLEGEMSQSQIREIEAELIKERLHEISLAMEVQGMMSDEDVNKIQIVRNFLKDNHDLQRTLEAEIQNLEILVQLYSQKQSTEETQEVNNEQEKDEGSPLQKRKRTL